MRAWWASAVLLALVACGTPDDRVSPASSAVGVGPAATSVDAWFELDAADLTPGNVAVTVCCREFNSPAGAPTTAAWGAPGGLMDGLLVVQRLPTESSWPDIYPERYFRSEPDGSAWMFHAFGLTDAERKRLADEVTLDADGFALADDSLRPVGAGVELDGDLLAQAYAAADGTVTLSVGPYRGQLDPLAGAVAVRPVSVAGVEGYAVGAAPGVQVVWPVGERLWGTLVFSGQIAQRVDELLATIVAVDAATITAAPLEHPEIDGQYRGVVSVIETPGVGPMIIFEWLESLPPQGGDVPLSGWDWDQVIGEESLNGTTWGGPWEVTGTWDGATFTVTQPPRPGTYGGGGSHGAPTPVCDRESLQPAEDALRLARWELVGWLAARADLFDGYCGLRVEALLPSAELSAALDQHASVILSVDYVFLPVS